jgi:hypothetical protein
MQAVKGEIQLTDEQREHADKRDLFARAEAKITAQKAKAEAPQRRPKIRSSINHVQRYQGTGRRILPVPLAYWTLSFRGV